MFDTNMSVRRFLDVVCYENEGVALMAAGHSHCKFNMQVGRLKGRIIGIMVYEV